MQTRVTLLRERHRMNSLIIVFTLLRISISNPRNSVTLNLFQRLNQKRKTQKKRRKRSLQRMIQRNLEEVRKKIHPRMNHKKL